MRLICPFLVGSTDMGTSRRWLVFIALGAVSTLCSPHNPLIKEVNASGTVSSFAGSPAATTNAPLPAGPGPTEILIQGWIEDYRRQLATPGIDAQTRKRLESQLEYYQEKLEDHRTNDRLWDNLHQARTTKNVEKVTESERALADYLALKLSSIEGRNYPTGMSLAAIMEHYNAHANPIKVTHGRWYARWLVITVVCCPILGLGFYQLRRKK